MSDAKQKKSKLFKLTETILVRETDTAYTVDLVKRWTEAGVTQLRVSLKCPITKQRLQVPCRGQDCTHIQCFDGVSFLKMNEKQFGKWLCNICSKPSPLNKLFVDGLFVDVLKNVVEDVEDIYFDNNGNWTEEKTDKCDYSIIDLSETLDVIDLTESDNEEVDGSEERISSVNSKEKEPENLQAAEKNATKPKESNISKDIVKETEQTTNSTTDEGKNKNTEIAFKTGEVLGPPPSPPYTRSKSSCYSLRSHSHNSYRNQSSQPYFRKNKKSQTTDYGGSRRPLHQYNMNVPQHSFRYGHDYLPRYVQDYRQQFSGSDHNANYSMDRNDYQGLNFDKNYNFHANQLANVLNLGFK